MTDWETLRLDLAALEHLFAGTDGDGMHVVLLVLPAGGALDDQLRRLTRTQASEALERAERATALLTRLAHLDPAVGPALTRLYHLIALLERHAWEDGRPGRAQQNAAPNEAERPRELSPDPRQTVPRYRTDGSAAEVDDTPSRGAVQGSAARKVVL